MRGSLPGHEAGPTRQRDSRNKARVGGKVRSGVRRARARGERGLDATHRGVPAHTPTCRNYTSMHNFTHAATEPLPCPHRSLGLNA